MRALIWLGGDFRYEAWGQTPELTGPFDLVICADGGGRHALRLKLPVDVLLGDFDSISPQEKQALAPRRLLPYAPDKDYTDGQLAVAEALRQGTKQLTLAGAFGDRLDHTLANIALLQQIAEAGATGTATDGRQIARLMARRLTLAGKPGQLISLWPIPPAAGHVSITGVRWPLHDVYLPWGNSPTISNEFTADICKIDVEQGELLVITQIISPALPPRFAAAKPR